jgi:hypothetical protein
VVVLRIITRAVATLVSAGYFGRDGGRRDEPEVCHTRCPRCDQKVRYAANRASREAMCPRCRRRWTLPATPEPLAKPRLPGLARRRVA